MIADDMRTGPTNPVLKGMAERLEGIGKKGKSPLWANVAKRLSTSTRSRAAVNLASIDRHTGEGEIIAVPGKVLSYGSLSKKLTIGAFSFSAEARKKIREAGGQALSLEELATKHPKGTNVKIMV